METTVNALKKNGHEVVVRDLYALDFQPVLKPEDTAAMKAGNIPNDIKTEQEFITKQMLYIYLPYMVDRSSSNSKRYVDRVFAFGFAYSAGEEGVIKLLKGKKGFIINTHGTPNEVYDKMGMTAGLKVTSDIGIFDFTGIEPVEHLLFGSIGYFDEDSYKGMLEKVEDTINSLSRNNIQISNKDCS